MLSSFLPNRALSNAFAIVFGPYPHSFVLDCPNTCEVAFVAAFSGNREDVFALMAQGNTTWDE